ncbi:MAG: VWA domain-containing protein [Streptosporangiaceae bacterium]
MKKLVCGALGAALLVTMAGCGSGGSPDGAGVIRVLAGSELADLKPILDQAAKDTGVTVRFDYAGTLDGVQKVVSGAAGSRYDAIWFSSNRYLDLHPGVRTGTATPIMSSPVVLGVRPEAAARLGWDRVRPTWAQIAAAAERRDFTYGMTNPATSNSGFSALTGVAGALNAGTDLDVPGIARVAPQLTRFFSAQTLTAGSSGWLSEAFLRQGAEVDGLVNYESVLLSLNASGRLAEPLTLVYPSDGVATADYPLTLLGNAAQGSYRKLTAYLLKPDVQTRIMNEVHRRPVRGSAAFPGPRDLRELPFPGSLETVDQLVAAFFNKIRRPARTIYVIDVSGSMAGQRITDLRAALVALTGAADVTRFHNREQVTLIPFSTRTMPPRRFLIPETDPGAELRRIRTFAEGLRPGGGTAIYSGLTAAYAIARAQVAQDPDRFTSIVLMTDGENANGITLGDFRTSLPRVAVKGVPVFPILFGTAREKEMNEVAQLTGGRAFDARAQSLESVFREIRGYQ